jgi:Leucine-rich repeat (LRR) protein
MASTVPPQGGITDNLPATLQKLNCSNNQITALENLPETLKQLCCSNNQITSLQTPMASTVPPQGGITDNLPETLKQLCCSNNPFLSNYNYHMNIKNLKRYNATKKANECAHLSSNKKVYFIASIPMIDYSVTKLNVSNQG